MEGFGLSGSRAAPDFRGLPSALESGALFLLIVDFSAFGCVTILWDNAQAGGGLRARR